MCVESKQTLMQDSGCWVSGLADVSALCLQLGYVVFVFVTASCNNKTSSLIWFASMSVQEQLMITIHRLES